MRILVFGYAVSTIFAGVCGFFGAGWVSAILVFWLGGAVASIALAVVPPSWRLAFLSAKHVPDIRRSRSAGGRLL